MFFIFNRKKVVRRVRRLNALTNTRAMLRLNPYAAVLKRQAILATQKRQFQRDEALAKARGVSSIFIYYHIKCFNECYGCFRLIFCFLTKCYTKIS